MDQRVKPAPHEIRAARLGNPKMRERDLAIQLGISEAELVAAYLGNGALRLEPRANDLLAGLEAVGEVMALTRNEGAVHEKIGVYDQITTGKHAAMALGKDIDLRIFPNFWAFGFAVEKRDGENVRRSLQFFDAAGDAVHKVHLRPASNLDAYATLVELLKSANQDGALEITPREIRGPYVMQDTPVDLPDLRDRWSKMTDTHQFFGLLRSLKLDRLQALRIVGADFAWQIDRDAVPSLLNLAAADAMPIMCFVGSSGCIQIHSGPISNVKPMGPWINIMDETFHLHLRLDHIQEVWAVRKPTADGHVTSVEAYDANGEMIIQFFGQRQEGIDEREDWRFLAENLPRIPTT